MLYAASRHRRNHDLLHPFRHFSYTEHIERSQREVFWYYEKILAPVLFVFTAAALLAGCKKNTESSLTPVTLNEVAHSIFYAPQYAAIELGYFEEEGIDLTLVNGAGADKVMTALVSGDADIGFMGSEASIYTYIQGDDDYAVNFAQLTQRAGNFLVGRTPEADFKWETSSERKF